MAGHLVLVHRLAQGEVQHHLPQCAAPWELLGVPGLVPAQGSVQVLVPVLSLLAESGWVLVPVRREGQLLQGHERRSGCAALPSSAGNARVSSSCHSVRLAFALSGACSRLTCTLGG